MTTITGMSVHTPTMFTTYGWRRRAGSIAHELVNSSEVALTLRPARARALQCEAVFAEKSAAIALEAELATGDPLDLADPDHPEQDMTFILAPGGELAIDLDKTTQRVWVLRWDAQEVGA